MKKRKYLSEIILAGCILVTSLSANADVLTLNDGQSITGKFISRDAKEVVFEIAGQQLKFDSNKVTGIRFAEPEPTTSIKKEAPAVKEPVKAEVAAKSVTAPAGTRLVVRTGTSLNTNKHATGHRFTARLEADMVIDNVVVATRGSTLYGVVTEAKKSGRLVGKASMVLTFTDIMINNQMVTIKTSGVKAITEAEAINTLGRTARAAAIGGLINGSKGAKDGAAVGLGLSLLGGGKSIHIPAGSLLEFQLAAPFTH